MWRNQNSKETVASPRWLGDPSVIRCDCGSGGLGGAADGRVGRCSVDLEVRVEAGHPLRATGPS